MTTRSYAHPALLLAALSLAASGCSAPAAFAAAPGAPGTEPAHRRTLTVTGTATLDLTPDCADVSLTLTTEGQRPKAAVSALRHKQDVLLEGLVAAGVQTGDIKLSGMSVGQAYDEKGKFRAFTASITVVASTRKFDLIGDIMEAASEAGTQNMSTSFRVSDLVSFKKKVRMMALQAAAEKAHETATALDTTLGKVSDINETAGDYRVGAFDNAYNAVDRSAAQIGPEMHPITMMVTVTYDLT